MSAETLGSMDFGGVEPPKKEYGTLKIPTDENTPLICKLVADPRRPKDAYFQVYYHRHMVGPSSRTDGRYHLCQKTKKESCPECDRFWDIAKEMKALKNEGRGYIKGADGKDAPTPEYAALKREQDLYRQSDRYWLLVLPIGTTKPQAVLVTKEIVEKLFGREAKKDWSGKDIPAIQGQYYAMKDRGRSPFNLKSDQGWIKMWRTGEPPQVTYHAVEAMIEGEIEAKDGSKITALQPIRSKVPEAVLLLTSDDIIDVSNIDIKNSKMSWTNEESLAYVESCGTAIPARCKKGGGFSDEASPSLLGQEELSPFGAPEVQAPVQAPVQAQATVKAAPPPAPVKAPPVTDHSDESVEDDLSGMF